MIAAFCGSASSSLARLFYGTTGSSSTSPKPNTVMMSSSHRVRVACVGDAHDQLNEKDLTALDGLAPDLVLYVGDFANENVQVVEKVLETRQPFAMVFGNHDAWHTATHIGRERAPYNRQKITEEPVRRMLALARDKNANASYTSLDFDSLGVSVVGGRPFSWGGPYWKHSGFYRDFIGVQSLDHSQSLICEKGVDRVPRDNSVIFLAHNGPSGLGAEPEDIVGRDFGDKPGGDFGDTDLRGAIDHARKSGRNVPLVVFGHMHKALQRGRFGGVRKMVQTQDGTVFVNAAVVPRVRGKGRCFTLVDLEKSNEGQYSVAQVTESWFDARGKLLENTTLYSKETAAFFRARRSVMMKPERVGVNSLGNTYRVRAAPRRKFGQAFSYFNKSGSFYSRDFDGSTAYCSPAGRWRFTPPIPAAVYSRLYPSVQIPRMGPWKQNRELDRFSVAKYL